MGINSSLIIFAVLIAHLLFGILLSAHPLAALFSLDTLLGLVSTLIVLESCIVVAIPEEMPLIFSFYLAFSVAKMREQNNTLRWN